MAVNKCFCGAKLSSNIKSIFGLRTQILCLVLVGCFLAGASAADTEVSCASVKSTFESKGMLSYVDIQEQPTSDAGGLCLNLGCCGSGAAGPLAQHARTHLEGALRAELLKLSETLANRARKFDEFFRRLLQQSKEDFDAMFKRTYGIIYEQHSFVFEQLFEQLERYYSRGDNDLDHVMETFFGILYQKMFTVLNSQYSFDEKYLKCVSEHMRETQPFEDVPKKLSVQLRRAFVATRTFHKALRAGSEVVRDMMQVGVSPECAQAWARLRNCGACSGSPVAACPRYCHNVLRGCLPTHADLAPQWDAYVDAVEKVSDRLIGPFNIVMVVEPIDIKISEAIMNFQEHNQEISQKIFQNCGKPVLGGGGAAGPFFAPDRSRRSVRSLPDLEWSSKSDDGNDFELETSLETLLKEDPALYSLSSQDEVQDLASKMAAQAQDRERFLQYMRGDIDAEQYDEHERRRRGASPPAAAAAAELDYRGYEFDNKRQKKGKKNKPDNGRDAGTRDSGSLARLVRETRARVRAARRYWAGLPFLLCPAQPPRQPCFNGTVVDSYTLPAAGEGSAALASNPEVRGVGSQPAQTQAVLVARQDTLRALTARLKDAYNGAEVQWRDADDLQVSQSSRDDMLTVAGSGSGSGDDSDDLPDDDEDRDYPGSGGGPPDDDDSRPPPVPVPSPGVPVPVPGVPVPEPPFTPAVVPPPGTNNVRIMLPPQTDKTDDLEPRTRTMDNVPPARDRPVTGSADRPSLQRALITYALPVVCAWFGTIVTDLM